MTRRGLLVVIGKAASGKTALARTLAGSGFAYLSASDVLRRTLASGGVTIDRHRLAEQGRLMRGEAGIERFHENLRAAIVTGRSDTVLDGPRFPETVAAVRSVVPAFLLVLLECSDSIRRTRLESVGRGDEWAWLNNHPTEAAVDEMRGLADLTCDGARTTNDTAADILGRWPPDGRY